MHIRPLFLLDLQGSVAVLYNWLQRETLSPHTWVTDYMNDLHLPVSFVGLSTQDRRFMYPQKEVGPVFCLFLPLRSASDLKHGYIKSMSVAGSLSPVSAVQLLQLLAELFLQPVAIFHLYVNTATVAS